jgi:ribonuclease P protein subunit RPR2
MVNYAALLAQSKTFNFGIVFPAILLFFSIFFAFMDKYAHMRKPTQFTRIAEARILKLFSEADKQFHKNPALSNRYVALARKISMKYKVRLPSSLQKRFCKHCYCFLVPSVNCRVRLCKRLVSYYCQNCKKYMRFPYIREQKSRKK